MSPEQAGRLARSLLDDVWRDGDEDDAPILPGATVDGYEVVAHVASGGTCEVYRARGADGSEVALKVLRSALPPEIEWRVFEREAAALGRLDHPTIARLIACGRAGGSRAYLAIEFVEGERLTSHACGSTTASIVEIFAAVCEGVDHAHRAGVIHRDLKPSNILVDASGRPRIVDFGVSLPAHVHRRCPHGRWSGGTLPYMSPEQIALGAWDLDSRTDVFSLGVILHQLLTGRRPFDLQGLEASEALARLRDGAPAMSAGGLLAGSRAMEGVVARALAFDRDLRFQSAGELAAAAREAAGL